MRTRREIVDEKRKAHIETVLGLRYNHRKYIRTMIRNLLIQSEAYFIRAEYLKDCSLKMLDEELRAMASNQEDKLEFEAISLPPMTVHLAEARHRVENDLETNIVAFIDKRAEDAISYVDPPCGDPIIELTDVDDSDIDLWIEPKKRTNRASSSSSSSFKAKEKEPMSPIDSFLFEEDIDDFDI